jgi:electron transport complex, RnfABCDGE type, C subunit
MTILSGRGRINLDGQKGLSKDKPINLLEEPQFVYMPLVLGASDKFDVHVKEGDKVFVGTKIATRTDMYVPIYASVSGVVKGIEKRMHTSGRPQNHIVIENDFRKERVKALEIENPDQLQPEEIVESIKELGIIGLGGAGFPTFIKYSNPKEIDTVLINGVECEPFITSDHLSMKRDVKALFDGTNFLLKAAKAKKAIIAIKKNKKDLWSLLQEESKKWPNIEPMEVPDLYPMGWERVLIEEIFKKEYDFLTAEIGVIVNNSSTAIAVSKGLRNGEAITHRVTTFSGNGIKNPQNVEVPIGTTVDYIIKKIGGYVDVSEGIVIGGGPMMGKSIMNDEFVIYPNNNAILILKKEEIEAIPCLKCGMCTEHCPARLQPVKIMEAVKGQDTDIMGKLDTLKCIECGMCTYVCPSKIEVTDFVVKAKRHLNLANARKNK